jgi:hypothetical protein
MVIFVRETIEVEFAFGGALLRLGCKNCRNQTNVFCTLCVGVGRSIIRGK